MTKLCDECETVAHCLKHGCIPKQACSAPVQERNFCERCGKRLGSGIHTCTPPAAQPAPVQVLPFGVGGGLVAIKTLLSRDPCVHANTAIEMIDAILKEHPAAPVQEPVAFLANGTRFKISYDSRQSGGQIHGIPPELGGRWVAFVAADDDCHLKLTTPPAAPEVCCGEYKTCLKPCTPRGEFLAAQRQWVGLTDEERNKLWRDVVKWGDPSHDDVDLIKAIEAKLKELNT